jgi:hypothetical protein
MEGYRTYWFIKLVLPTPLSPRMITYSLSDYHATQSSQCHWRYTFSSFLREDMLWDGAPGARGVCYGSSCFGLGAATDDVCGRSSEQTNARLKAVSDSRRSCCLSDGCRWSRWSTSSNDEMPHGTKPGLSRRVPATTLSSHLVLPLTPVSRPILTVVDFAFLYN